ncbi:Nitrate reductase (NADH) [Hordeum vulgare]|nr:Nitrate reductase (NADH) [Hordeum vulgare]
MDDHGNGGVDTERRRCRASDAAHKRGSRRWLNYGLLQPPTFERHELEEYERENTCVGSTSAGASSLRTITPMKRKAEELGPLAVKLEDDAGQLRGGVIGPEDYLPLGQEDHLMRTIIERSARKVAEDAACNRRELEIEQIFLEQGVTTSQATASKEADLHVLKAEQDKI